jgi:hypothetical protein
MHLLRVARLYNKVLLFVWDGPAPVETFLEPARIDWSVHSGGLGQDVMELLGIDPDIMLTPFDGRHLDSPAHPMFQLIQNGTGADSFRDAKVVYSANLLMSLDSLHLPVQSCSVIPYRCLMVKPSPQLF